MKAEKRMRPVIILPENTMSKRDLSRLNKNGLCVVEAKDPSQVRFCEPPPEGYSAQEQAAIKLSRFLLSPENTSNMRDRANIGHLYAQFIIQGTPLSSNAPTAVARAKK